MYVKKNTTLSWKLCNDSDISSYYTKCENRAINVVCTACAHAKYLLIKCTQKWLKKTGSVKPIQEMWVSI